MVKSIKTVMTVATLAAVMSGCTSSSEKDAEAARLAAEQRAAEEAAAAAAAAQSAEADAKAAAMAKCDNAESVFYFDFDQSLLSVETRAALLVQAECLKMSGSDFRLEGHADERGSREYNMALGERRANAVRDFLILNGLGASTIETVSYGEERAIATGSDESSWSKNRRVELK